LDGPFFIHLEDPGFPEHPWPGQRRLGPYPTSEEAVEQAVSDASLGHGVALGVYAEPESEKRLSGRKDGRAIVARAEIRKRGESKAKQAKEQEADMYENWRKDIEAMLPAGVGWEDMLRFSQILQERVAQGQSYPPPEFPDPNEEPEL
jgi:hypothetical protein